LGQPDTTTTAKPTATPAQLPFTGGDPHARVLIGLFMAVVGGALLGLSRKVRSVR
jgi:hypothetical protein